MQQDLDALIDAFEAQADAEFIRVLAARCFPLAPDEEGWFSDICEWVVGAREGSVDASLKAARLMTPLWWIHALKKREGGWTCTLHGTEEQPGLELEEGTCFSLEAEAADMASAIMLAVLYARWHRPPLEAAA